MRATRFALTATGIVMGLWGLWLMRDFRFEQLSSAGLWLVAGVIAHDVVLSGVVVGAGVVIARLVPAVARKPVVIGLIIWGTVTLAVTNVLSGQGGKPDNDSILGRPYLESWLVLSAAVAVGVAFAVWRWRAGSVRPSRTTPDSA